jgi:hypothetical protein
VFGTSEASAILIVEDSGGPAVGFWEIGLVLKFWMETPIVEQIYTNHC